MAGDVLSWILKNSEYCCESEKSVTLFSGLVRHLQIIRAWSNSFKILNLQRNKLVLTVTDVDTNLPSIWCEIFLLNLFKFVESLIIFQDYIIGVKKGLIYIIRLSGLHNLFIYSLTSNEKGFKVVQKRLVVIVYQLLLRKYWCIVMHTPRLVVCHWTECLYTENLNDHSKVSSLLQQHF